MSAFLALAWEFLCARTTSDDHLALFRTANNRPITGSPITGWRY